jgi:alpha-galactosidase
MSADSSAGRLTSGRQLRAPQPPMGWNSWDVYGASVTEAEVLRNADYMAANMKAHGWEYIVVDIQWSEPRAHSSTYRPFAPLEMDQFSRLLPAANRFPSAARGTGFRQLAADIHDRGLKLGIHAMRGIPRQAVHQNTALLGTDARARDIAANSICPWNTDMYGVNAHAPGAQEYYDSIFALYAEWGVDLVKVDDVLAPYATGEIELIRAAIEASGRDMVLSLSCGPVDISHAEHLTAHADMWRMTGDVWDTWDDLLAMFDFCATWSRRVSPGTWPDADMLPVGHLAVRSAEHGIGERWTRLSRDEQVSMMTLWCIFRSPLMVSCELPANDEWTLRLLTNDEVLDVARRSRHGRQLRRDGNLIVWQADGGPEDLGFLAVFNIGWSRATFTVPLALAGLPDAVTLRDLWSHEDLGSVTRSLVVEVPAHGARLLQVHGRVHSV